MTPSLFLITVLTFYFRPGVKCSDIAKELNEMLLDRDMLHLRTFGYGHSFGVISHYYGREPGLELREDIDTVIQVNIYNIYNIYYLQFLSTLYSRAW